MPSERKEAQDELKAYRKHRDKRIQDVAKRNLRVSLEELRERLYEIDEYLFQIENLRIKNEEAIQDLEERENVEFKPEYKLLDDFVNYCSFRVINYRATSITGLFAQIRNVSNMVIKDGITIDDKFVKSRTRPYVRLMFKQTRGADKGKVSFVMIKSEFLNNYDEFRGRIEEIAIGEVTGSDSFDLNEKELITDMFDIVVISRLKTRGACELKYQCYFAELDGSCWLRVLETLCKLQSNDPNRLCMLLLQLIFDEEINENLDPIDYLCNKNTTVDQDPICALYMLNVRIHSNVSIDLNQEFLDQVNDDSNYLDNRELFNEKKKKSDNYYRLRVSDLGDDVLTLDHHNTDIVKWNGVSLLGDLKSYIQEKYLVPCYVVDVLLDDKHVDIINNKYVLSNVYMSKSCEFAIVRKKSVGIEHKKKGKVFTQKDKVLRVIPSVEMGKRNEIEMKFEVAYLWFDYETVVDFNESNVMIPYSVSALCLTKSQYNELSFSQEFVIAYEKLPKMEDEVKYYKCRNYIESVKLMPVCFIGYDCNEQFYNYYSKLVMKKRLIFIGFNSSQYDNFILINWLKKNYPEWVTHVMYTNNSIFNAKIGLRHEMFDVRRHLNTASLKRLCESFSVKYGKLDFDHYEAQELHEKKELITYMQNNKELIDYNNMDVFCLALLMARYEKSLKTIKAFDFVVELTEIKTVGSMMFKAWNNDLLNNDIKTAAFDVRQINYYNDILKFKVAGRCELYNGIRIVNERHVSMDACSMYPYVLSVNDVYYPYGRIIEVENEDEIVDNKIGFFYCDIDQSELWNKNLPLIYPKKSVGKNDWDHKEILTDYFINTEEIKYLRQWGCKVDTKKGIMFEFVKKGCDMFRIINELMIAKGKQDLMKATRGDYNEALRETLKLTMNSLTGKVIERLHTDKIVELKNIVQYEQLAEKYPSLSVINVASNNSLLLQYKVSDEEVFGTHRPVFLAALIYTYARRHLYEHVISRVPRSCLIYTDTDSVKMTHDAFIKWRDSYAQHVKVPHWQEVENIEPKYIDFPLVKMKTENGVDKYEKVFGSYEDENAEMDAKNGVYNNYGVYFAKKCYFIGRKDGENVKIYKSKLKGVRDNDLYLPKDASYLPESKYVVNGVLIIPDNMNELNEFYNSEVGEKLRVSYKDNFHRLATEILCTKSARVLCLSFQKKIKNAKKYVSIDHTSRFNRNTCNVVLNIHEKTLNI